MPLLRSTCLALILAAASVAISGCGDGDSGGSSGLTLETDINWWYTAPDVQLAPRGSVRIRATFLNTSGGDLVFTNPSPRIDVWGDPSVINPPLTISDEPLGVVPAGATFIYDIRADVSGLPLTDLSLGVRPLESTMGTLTPSDVQLVSAFVGN